MGTINLDYLRCFTETYTETSTRGSFINLVPRVCPKNRTERANFSNNSGGGFSSYSLFFFAKLSDDLFSFFFSYFVCLKFMLAMRNVPDSNASIEKM